MACSNQKAVEASDTKLTQQQLNIIKIVTDSYLKKCEELHFFYISPNKKYTGGGWRLNNPLIMCWKNVSTRYVENLPNDLQKMNGEETTKVGITFNAEYYRVKGGKNDTWSKWELAHSASLYIEIIFNKDGTYQHREHFYPGLSDGSEATIVEKFNFNCSDLQ
jgi:hypothetical protein